jgi:Icc-related predicted phosphoesterase/osmotically-inducible protein OsmY
MRVLAIADVCGRVDALERLEMKMRNEALDGILFVGSALAGGRRAEEWARVRAEVGPRRWTAELDRQEREDARKLDAVLGALARFGRPVCYVPGDLDAPARLFLQAAAGHELAAPQLRCVHRSFAAGPRNYVVAGFGGTIDRSERETELVLHYPEWEAESGLDFARRLDQDRILLFHMPPRFAALDWHDGHNIGSPLVEQLIHTHDPRLAVVGHAMDGQGQAVVGRSLVVNPGPLCRGHDALIDLAERTATFRRLEGIGEEEPSAADQALQARVEEALAAEPATGDAGIRVRVREGIARLVGNVRSIAVKAAAERTARGVRGVQGVENALTADTALAARITSRLAEDPRTALAGIDVACVAGEVTLSGVAPSPRVKAAAEEVARSTPGVVLVVNDVRVEPEEAATGE